MNKEQEQMVQAKQRERILTLIRGFCDENQMIFGITKAKGSFRAKEGLQPEAAKSILVVGHSYNKKFEFSHKDREQSHTVTKGCRGELSLIAIGEDYHRILRRKLEELAALLLKHVSFQYYITVDTGEPIERELAVSAGIGFFCRNYNIASDMLGSLFNIGLLYTDLELAEHPEGEPPQGFRLHSRCQNCTACVRACEGLRDVLKDSLNENTPRAINTGATNTDLLLPAITHEGFVAHRCLSYISQKKGELSEGERLLLGGRLYGCDECRKVCPLNKDVAYSAVVTDIEEAFPDLEGILKLTKEEFDKKYGDRAFHWRGLANLQRNAKIAMENNYAPRE